MKNPIALFVILLAFCCLAATSAYHKVQIVDGSGSPTAYEKVQIVKENGGNVKIAEVAIVSAYDLVPAEEVAAIKDGTTTYDCAAVINAYLGSSDARPLYFPAGTYKYSQALAPKYNGRIIFGDGPDQTILMPTSTDENGLECPMTNPPNGLVIRDLSFVGAGADTQVSAGVVSQHDDGDFFMSRITLENVSIEGFEKSVIAENLPLLTCRNVNFRDFVVCADLIKCDTFLFESCAAGNIGNTGVGTVFKMTASAGTPAGQNFAGKIVAGEYGNCAHFLDLSAGHLDVESINIETITGDYVCYVGNLGTLRLIHPRIALATGAASKAVVRLNYDSGSNVPRLVIANLWGSYVSWREVECIGAFNYNSDIINIGETSVTAVWSSTVGGTAQMTKMLGPVASRRTTAAIPGAHAANTGRVISYIPSVGVGGAATRSAHVVVSYDLSTGTYAHSVFENDRLMRIINATSTKAGNVSSSETDVVAWSVIAGTLATTNEELRFKAYGKFAANGNNKRIRILFGTDVILDTTSLALNDGSWNIEVSLQELSTSVWRAVAVVSSDNATLGSYSKVIDGTQGLNVNRTFYLKATGASTDDIQMFAGKLAFVASEFTY